MKLPSLLSGQRRWWFTALVANGMLQALLAIATAMLVQRGFDAWILTPASNDINGAYILTALVLVMLANALLRWRAHLDGERLGQNYVHHVRQRLFRQLTRLGSNGVQHLSRGAIMLRFVGDLSAMRNWISLGLARLTVSGLTVLIALAALAWIQPVISLSVGIAAATATGLALLMGPGIRHQNRVSRRLRGRMAANLNDRVTHLNVITGFAQQQREQHRFSRHSRQVQEALVTRAYLIGLLRSLSEATATLASLCTLVIGAWLLQAGWATPGSLVAAMVVTGLLAPGLQDMGRVYEYWNGYLVARDKQLQILRLRPPRHALHPLPAGPGIIKLENAALGHRLHPINLRLVPGEPTCILGANGAGKSTLLRLIAGQLSPDKGRVLLDGIDLSQLTPSARAAGCALVSSDLPLLRGSLRYNLCYGLERTKNADEALANVISQCRLDAIIQRLPQGLDSQVSDQNPLLSSGEIARVLLARALLSAPRVLLLDEPDANLDTVSREVLLDTLRGFPGTLVFSTHNPSMARYATLHLCLANGRLKAAGELTTPPPLSIVHSRPEPKTLSNSID
ncbi:ATP-binding cassette domain-containing protein [Aestuariirhabdus sp. LZHN29]|uniref:ATP-binding cassette domain-containing protein n=1 Tax=Aestuariirhabdus sp. LZHN29 TaxID=3417462 RepID=UPI003CF020A5